MNDMAALLTQRARALRRRQTPSETKLWQHLRAKRLENVKFFRQYPVGPYIADFAAPNIRLIIEVDGGGHAELKQQAYDAERDAWFTAQEWRVLRIWSNEVEKNIEGVVEQILLYFPRRALRG